MNLNHQIFWDVLAESSTVNVLRSQDHGPAHWARVANNGRMLAERTPGADLVVIEYFALFHDAQRDNEFHDPEHGIRGNKLAIALSLEMLLTETQWDTFLTACAEHDWGTTTNDPTIGCCWDADRLDLPRVGITPDSRFMSTEAGKRSATINHGHLRLT